MHESVVSPKLNVPCPDFMIRARAQAAAAAANASADASGSGGLGGAAEDENKAPLRVSADQHAGLVHLDMNPQSSEQRRELVARLKKDVSAFTLSSSSFGALLDKRHTALRSFYMLLQKLQRQQESSGSGLAPPAPRSDTTDIPYIVQKVCELPTRAFRVDGCRSRTCLVLRCVSCGCLLQSH